MVVRTPSRGVEYLGYVNRGHVPLSQCVAEGAPLDSGPKSSKGESSKRAAVEKLLVQKGRHQI